MRAKYLDWCSAQLADHFLALSPHEIFQLAERAAHEERIPARSLSASGTDEDELLSYRAVVERVTEVLARETELPSLEEFIEMYEQNPAPIEARLLGFWLDVGVLDSPLRRSIARMVDGMFLVGVLGAQFLASGLSGVTVKK